MSDIFKIFIDRLKGGQTQKIEETLDPSFLGLDEPELQFKTKVEVKGEAYLTDTHLVLHLKAHTTASMPCAICNEMISVDLRADNFYHTEDLDDIRSAVFDFKDQLREALLVEVPNRVECNLGNCPNREVIKPYLKTEETYFPFAKIDCDKEKKEK